ncbi:BCCT family transporter [Candidatus Formimonas warabiya]|uniref:BCCT transporter n=1 Tax=Formimonas warabiya TaxID=1761012 RepID=A0A3G1KVP4_FORW1|nr:BCCT family transporter [Candidatus Formimonas warabiya]ATW26449.1 BCCT transporter [Candidatus Formimonas warabiya]
MFSDFTNGKLKKSVFWPPFLLLIAAVIYSFADKEGFAKLTNDANYWIFIHFGWLFMLTAMALLFICLAVCFAPIGKVRIGGSHAKPLLSRWKWFAITLCTGIAVGILFWGVAEPMSVFSAPPNVGIKGSSTDAAIYAMSTMYFHWTFLPYAIYTVPALLFAFAYYNMKKPFSLGSLLYPLLGERSLGIFGRITDAVCVYALVLGMAASLGMGILSIAGGLSKLFLIKANLITWAVIDIVIVVTFVISAITGLMNGIKWLCDINGKIFLALPIYILVFGSATFVANFSVQSLGHFLKNFFEMAFYTGGITNDQWPVWWTIFCWANWMAWAPITGVFLGRIGYGYTVREFIGVNLIGTSLFGMVWFASFSGSALHMQLFQNVNLVEVLNTTGSESVIYAFFQQFPLSVLLSSLFILTIYLSYVTGSDAMTSSIGGLCSTGISPESPEPSMFQKVIWGGMLGIVAWVMIAFAGIDGVKMLSNLGGFPVLFLEIAWAAALVKVAWNPSKYDYFKEDYTKDGYPIIFKDDQDQGSNLNQINANPPIQG